jgi:hypothetical protein
LVPFTQSSRTRIYYSQFSTFTVDRNRTVSRRSKPNSRTTLIGEQPNPWNLLQHQDVMSRHRGAKRSLQSGLLGIISLLSPAYLLSVKRRSFLTEPSDHYSRFSSLLDLSVLQSSKYILLRSPACQSKLELTIAHLRYLVGGDLPSQTTTDTRSKKNETNTSHLAHKCARFKYKYFIEVSPAAVTEVLKLFTRLRIKPLVTMYRYSKGARGLFV